MSLFNTILGNRGAGTTSVGNTSGPGSAVMGRGGVPQALLDRASAQRAEFTNADGTERTVRHDNRDLPFGRTGQRTLPPGSFGAELRRMANHRDAGNAVIVADNATVHILSYCYGTHKSMEAWLTDTPKDGMLKLNLIASPSTHAGYTQADKQANFEKFAKTNVYNVEILYPDGTRETKKFDVAGNSPPKYNDRNPAPNGTYASASPEIVIDLNKWSGKGDVRIRGWADGSAGVAGYQEKRETTLHLG